MASSRSLSGQPPRLRDDGVGYTLPHLIHTINWSMIDPLATWSWRIPSQDQRSSYFSAYAMQLRENHSVNRFHNAFLHAAVIQHLDNSFYPDFFSGGGNHVLDGKSLAFHTAPTIFLHSQSSIRLENTVNRRHPWRRATVPQNPSAVAAGSLGRTGSVTIRGVRHDITAPVEALQRTYCIGMCREQQQRAAAVYRRARSAERVQHARHCPGAGTGQADRSTSEARAGGGHAPEGRL